MKTIHMPDTRTQASHVKMASFKGSPCQSLYRPTHRRHPDNQQDPTRFRHLVKALSLHKVQLHECDRNALDTVALAAGVPQTIAAALGVELTEPYITVSSYGGIGGGHMSMQHSQGGKKEKMDSDAKRYFIAVDRVMLEYHSLLSDLPLMLAVPPEHHYLFHEISHNPFLMVDSQELTNEDLRHG